MRTRTLWLLSLLTTAVVVAVSVALHDPPPDPPVDGTRLAAPSSLGRAVAALRDWDRRRALAWADDDPAAVRALYVSRSRAGRRDLAMLAAYHRRGLRVTTMQRQVLAVRVLTASDRRWSLEVTDRLARARVRRDGVSVGLPRSHPVTRRIELRQVAGRWRVAEVYEE